MIGALRTRLDRQEVEMRAVLLENAELTHRLDEANAELRSLRASARATARHKASPPEGENRIVFASNEEWVRHEITMAWMRRFSPEDRLSQPLAGFIIGPEFGASVRALPCHLQAKVWRCAVDVATGRWRTCPALAAHPLRATAAAHAPDVVRAADGARCMRVSVEAHTPAARRMHFWLMTDGTVEFSRVVPHDNATA
ncbi:hypothetical protein [Subtercola boreus]|nr:hypothetical protein [Subtercola boreus]